MEKQFINKETGFPIAQMPEDMPPLRDGYIRLVHQTNSEYQESFIENGLIYNKEYAGRIGQCFSKYFDIDSMAVPYSENSFWERLTSEDTRHKGADSIAVFDMPSEEFLGHKFPEVAQHLNGTISSGYLVGFLPNYGTKDENVTQKLSQEEMEEKRNTAKHNVLPPEYETPNWKENIQVALDKNIQHNKEQKHKPVFEQQNFPDYSSFFSFVENNNKSMDSEPVEEEFFAAYESVEFPNTCADISTNDDTWGDWEAWNDADNDKESPVSTNEMLSKKINIQDKIDSIRNKLHVKFSQELDSAEKNNTLQPSDNDHDTEVLSSSITLSQYSKKLKDGYLE